MKRRMKRLFGVIGFWVAWPLWWLILHGTHRTRVIFFFGDEVLLILPTLATNKWSLPGGGMRKGEEPAVAACREVHEELGISIVPDMLQPLAVEVVSEDSGIPYHCHYYGVVLTERPVLRLTWEVADAHWFPLQDGNTIAAQQIVRRALTLWEAR